MTWMWTLLGTFAQLSLAVLMFMLVAVSAGSIANGATLGKATLGILNFSLFALPGLCVASAAIVIGLHVRGGSASSYWWYVLPLAGVVAYIAYAIWLGSRS